jgi:hypothetical protein
MIIHFMKLRSIMREGGELVKLYFMKGADIRFAAAK